MSPVLCFSLCLSGCWVTRMTRRCWRPTSWSGGSSSRSATSCPSLSASWRSHWWASKEATRSPTWRTASSARWGGAGEGKSKRLGWRLLTQSNATSVSSLCSWCWTHGTSPSSPTLKTGYKTAPWSSSTLRGWGRPLTPSWSSECESPTVRNSDTGRLIVPVAKTQRGVQVYECTLRSQSV